MKRNKYTVPENEDLQPGTKDGVLKNYLGLTLKKSIEKAEALRVFAWICLNYAIPGANLSKPNVSIINR